MTLLIIEILCSIGFKRNGIHVDFPNPKGIKNSFPLALTNEEIRESLYLLPEWKITNSPILGKSPKEMQELTKKFTFKTFEDAISYINRVLPFISEVQHHPR